MTAYSALSRIARPGQLICIQITENDETPVEKNGLLIELLSDGLVLETESETEFISAENIASWRLPKKIGSTTKSDQLQTINFPEINQNDSVKQPENIFSPNQNALVFTIPPEELKIQFAGDPVLNHPLPVFDAPDLQGAPKKEIDRWRNRYEYAKKVREPARMAQDVAHVAELAESLNLPSLYLLAGSFANLSGLGTGKARILYESALERGSRQAAIAVASLAIDESDWQKAAEMLLEALLIPDDTTDNDTLVRVLGQCLLKITDKKLPGLGNLLESGFSGTTQRLTTSLVAVSLQEDLQAYNTALRGDSESLRHMEACKNLFRERKKINLVTQVEDIPIRPKESGSRRGRISAFYRDREFGFIVEDTTGQTWYFNLSSVIDGSLIADLTNGKIRQYVRYTGNPEAASGKYPPAHEIQIVSTNGTILVEKRERAPLGIRLAVIPKDGSYYALAKRAEQMDDLENAEALYRKEIEHNGSHIKSAVKDLAALLSRTGKSEKAIELLQKYRSRYLGAELISVDQMITQFLVKARRFIDASQLLAHLAVGESNSRKRRDWLRQEAYCYYAAGDFDTALSKLKKLQVSHPTDDATLLLIERVKQAKESASVVGNVTSSTDEVVEGDESLASLALGLSTLARHQLDNCELRGVDARVRESNNFTERDFKQVEKYLDGLRGRRPRERADYLLTLAVLCEKAPEAVKENNVHLFLRRHFVAFAEAAIGENAPLDVIRCYALESLLLCPITPSKGAIQSIEIAWVLLLGTYLSEQYDPNILLQPETGDRLRILLKRLIEKPLSWSAFLKDAPFYKFRAPNAFSFLEKELQNTLSPISIDGLNEKIRVRREDTDFHGLFSGLISAERLRNAIEILAQRVSQSPFALDRQRIREAVRLFSDSADYALERHFRERETRYLRLDVDIKRYLDEIMRLPTHLSIEKLHPLLSSLLSALSDDFSRSDSARPSLEIRNVLDSDFYVLNQGQVALRLLLTSKDESSPPIEAIDLLAEGGSSEPCHSPEPLHGGQSRELELIIRPTDRQVRDGAFTVNIAVQYRNRSGAMERLSSQSLAVRLGNNVFEEILNPYSRYSGGSPVEDETMFFGRNLLVERIVQHLSIGDVGQCFVLYGQKRSGKSSVLKQVEKRLLNKFFFISLSAGAFDPTSLWKSFARLLIQELEFKLEDLEIDLPDGWPSSMDTDAQPIEAIRNVSRKVRKLDYRMIVAVDEFTYIFENSQSSIEDFMRGWKALLEAQMFNALLIGQDTMPRFKQTYPNEFGVTHDERISYLSKEEAENLANQPLLLNKESRYRGQALDRLFDLTAGSPFFLQIVCDRLVRHLNSRHAPFVTEADIEQVRQQLTVGGDSLPPERFDPLVTAAGEKVAIIPREDLWKLLARIAKESLHSGWCYRNAIADLPRSEEATKDLIDREVLAAEGDRVSIRVGLFAAWLRANQ